MTADPFAAAADLVSRSAAAYAASIPEHPVDEGFFGPGSVAWRVSSDLSSPVAGLRALHLQALHPLAMAGVDQHSDWRQDPVGRLAATNAYLATVTLSRVKVHDHTRYFAAMKITGKHRKTVHLVMRGGLWRQT